MKKLEGFQTGINLGGWLSQGTLDDHHLDTFITKSDIDTIAGWGMDHIRLPIDFENIENEDGSKKEKGYFLIDQCIGWARENHLNVVLDLHKTFGYIFDDPAYSSDFFHSEELQEHFYRIWDNLSSHFAKDADILIVELLNEVVPLDVIDEWNAIADKCIQVIRKNSKDLRILYGGVGYNAVSSVKYLLPPQDENIIYNFHTYAPLLFTHQSAYWVEGMPQNFHIEYPAPVEEYAAVSEKFCSDQSVEAAVKDGKLREFGPDYFDAMFREALQVSEERGVPLYCGEYGVIDQASPESTLRWYRDITGVFRKYGIGHAAWNYKEKDFGLCGSHYDSIRDELLKL